MLCVGWLYTLEGLNLDVVNIFGAAARYHQVAVGSSHDDAHPDNSTQHTGKIYSAPLYIFRVVLLLLRQHSFHLAHRGVVRQPRQTDPPPTGELGNMNQNSSSI